MGRRVGRLRRITRRPATANLKFELALVSERYDSVAYGQGVVKEGSTTREPQKGPDERLDGCVEAIVRVFDRMILPSPLKVKCS